MSCLQSLNEMLDMGRMVRDEGLAPLPSALVSAATSYLTQGLPTLLGQLERTAETERETTYIEKNAFLTQDMQYALGKVSGKTPVWEYQQIPYIDAWGRHESSGELGERALNNLLNPAYTSKIEENAVEQELLRLYHATGERGVLPAQAEKYVTVNGEKRYLSAEEYVKYAETRGSNALRLAQALTVEQNYAGLEDWEKAAAIEAVYSYAAQIARADIDDGVSMDSWVVKAKEAEKTYKIPVETYILLKTAVKGIESLKDSEGDSIPNSKGLLIMQKVYSMGGLTAAQREAMFGYLGVGETVIHYDRKTVDKALAGMRK